MFFWFSASIVSCDLNSQERKCKSVAIYLVFYCFQFTYYYYYCCYYYCRLGGVMVSVLATEPKGCGFEPSPGDGFSRAIKIRNTPSFG
jgi:hypothetical protein